METGNENWKRKPETEMGTKDAPITGCAWVSLFTGLDYWTDLFTTTNHFSALQLDSPTVELQTMVILACNTWPLAAQYPFDYG